ncbi:MAG: type II 3-dehydroquinate dehydratase [Rickettsiales bacterium]|nr:type II 3-dehydroquinate dehydratase [Rickettsiales bacterium]
MKKILILNGPNLNMLGKREPDIYGHITLGEIEKRCKDLANSKNIEIDFFQSNNEADLIDKIHKSSNNFSGIIINAGAFTHTSIAIMDALLLVNIPVIEVHISNIFRREQFRHNSYISLASKGVICGLGVDSYLLAITALSNLMK